MNDNSKTITIGIADDEALFRKGMKLILQSYEDVQVVIEAEDGKDLLEQIQSSSNQPNVILLDLRMPNLDGVEVAKMIGTNYPDVRIIVLSTHFSRAYVINMIELGASAYLPKNTDPDEVVRTIRGVMQNGFHYNQEVLQIIRDRMTSKSRVSDQFPFQLTPREKEILQLICEQFTTTKISQKLFISPRTVDGHRNNLLSKSQCKNVAGLVVFALQNDLVKINKWKL